MTEPEPLPPTVADLHRELKAALKELGEMKTSASATRAELLEKIDRLYEDLLEAKKEVKEETSSDPWA